MIRVLIIGSSIVKGAHFQAVNSPGGKHLSLQRLGVHIDWAGQSGLQLEGLIKLLNTYANIPVFILLHCGGNNIGLKKLHELRLLVVDLVQLIKAKFPEVILIWSEILPRFKWRYSVNQKAMDVARKRLNSFAAKHVISCGGKYLRYPDIKLSCPELFYSDGVHLSDLGYTIYINTIQGGIEHFLTYKSDQCYPSTC